MLLFLIDENFDQRILRGIRLRLPNFDFVIVQEIGLRGVDDSMLLEWAARAGRIILTHVVNTVTKFAIERIRRQLPMPGIIVVPEQMEIGAAIEDLEIIARCSIATDLVNQIQYLPL